MDLRAQLQAHLGNAFVLERELGGGGMSRVFVANEVRLSRKIVVKVLSPELAQGLNAERFEREILLAASLQQANIVPVLAAGDIDGLPYFTMPFIEGESLRTRLDGSGLPISDVLAILRDVTEKGVFRSKTSSVRSWGLASSLQPFEVKVKYRLSIAATMELSLIAVVVRVEPALPAAHRSALRDEPEDGPLGLSRQKSHAVHGRQFLLQAVQDPRRGCSRSGCSAVSKRSTRARWLTCG